MDQGCRRFGRYEVFLLKDGFFEASLDVITHANGPQARADAITRWGKPAIGIDVNCFLLRDGAGITLVDAGTGSAWGAAFGHARTALASLGVAPDQVGRVLLTHIHGDHALGLFDEDAASFPQAEIVVPEADLAFFTDEGARKALPKARQGAWEIAAKLRHVYGKRLRTINGGPVLPEIAALALPGHTPGQMGYRVGDAPQPLFLWGDLLHLADLQPTDPNIGLVFDLDGAVAARTRRAILGRAVDEGWTVAGGHVSGFFTVRNVGDAFAMGPG